MYSQPHSTQNMFKRANDSKTNLILPLLSAVDILRPLLLILENVHGFINCRLMAKQVTQHIIEGGYKQGALKLLIRALIDMGFLSSTHCNSLLFTSVSQVSAPILSPPSWALWYTSRSCSIFPCSFTAGHTATRTPSADTRLSFGRCSTASAHQPRKRENARACTNCSGTSIVSSCYGR